MVHSLWFLLVITFCTAQDRPIILGTSISDRNALIYDSKQFTCKDGSKIIPFERVNDNYCDCADQSDEPGTSACPNGLFWCVNKGFKGKRIFSSMVHDSICDCCDGSDELGNIECPNTCQNLAKEAKKELEIEFEKFSRGLEEKEKIIEEVKGELEKKRVELETKKIELEKLRIEKEEKEEIKRQKQAEEDRMRRELELKREEEEKNNTASVETEGTQSPEAPTPQENPVEPEASTPTPPPSPPPSIDEIEIEEENEEPIEEEAKPKRKLKDSYEEKLAQFEEMEDDLDIDEELEPYKEETNKANEDFQEVSNRYRGVEEEVKKLEELISMSFGENNEYYSLYGKCYSVDTAEYNYELCAFDKVTQRPKHGGSSTSLGRWKNNEQDEWKKNFSVMLYKDGQKCWGGPDRSTKVSIFCDKETRVAEPQEPNKCEYTLKLYTPLACNREHLQALEMNLMAEFEEN